MPVAKAIESLDVAFRAIQVAKENIGLVSWISPVGDFYIDTPQVITSIIQEGSWRQLGDVSSCVPPGKEGSLTGTWLRRRWPFLFFFQKYNHKEKT